MNKLKSVGLGQRSEGGRYKLYWWQASGDLEWFKAGEVEGMRTELERREKEQISEREEEENTESIELLRNEMTIPVVCRFFAFSPRGESKGGAVKESKAWLARVDVWVTSVLICLTKREIRGFELQKPHIYIRRKRLELAMG